MLISHEFDESMAQMRQRQVRIAMRTALKLNNRIKMFLSDIEKNKSLNKTQREDLKMILLKIH